VLIKFELVFYFVWSGMFFKILRILLVKQHYPVETLSVVDISIKICIIEVYLLKYFFESHLIYKWRYYRQTIFNQLNIMDKIGLCHSFAILWEIYVMRNANANYGSCSIDIDCYLCSCPTICVFLPSLWAHSEFDIISIYMYIYMYIDKVMLT
jgi:hypothetical protein